MNMSQEWPDSMEFWRSKRIIVTGGAGFLGSFVVEKLKECQAGEIIVPRSAQYDLRSLDAVQQLLSDTAQVQNSSLKPVDMVIHLAANVGGIGANREHPAEFFYDNLMMGTQLLHESWRSGVAKFVGIGTICSYPKFAPIPFREEDLWDGFPEETNAPYGLAKKMLLVQSQAYRQQYGYNSINLLPVNLYGPRDNFDLETSHVIPALIRKCLEAKQRGDEYIVAWGDGSPTREFLYVEDAAAGIILACERYNLSEPVNLGSSQEVSIRELVETVVDQTGFGGQVIWDSTKPNGQPRRKLNVIKATSLFEFHSTIELTEGLKRTILWWTDEGQHSSAMCESGNFADE